jgi:glycerol-3-phosphate dehydrogenase
MKKEFYKKIEELESLKDHEIDIEITSENIAVVSGEVTNWQDVVDIGHIAGEIQGIRGVVNNISAKKVKREKKDRKQEIEKARKIGKLKSVDVVIIGGGVIGTGIARELSKFDIETIVIEKNSDLSEGTTKANNGMIHSGFDSKTGSLKAQMNVKGNAMYDKWQEELGFRLVRSGSFVAGFDESDDEYLNMYLERGLKNGVPGIEILSAEEARKLEPNLHHSVKKVLWTPTAGYVEPYEVTIALAENAVDNGVEFMLNTEVLDIELAGDSVKSVVTDKGIIEASIVINAAGLYTDDIAEMVDDRFYTIHPRRGSLIIFDKNNKDIVRRFIGTPPRNFTKGGGPTQTPEGNPLWGPSAIEVEDKEDLAVGSDDIQFIMEKCSHLAEGIKANSVITFFSGLRASNYIEDFIIEPSRKVEGFIHVAGIQSPGLASAPAIAEMVVGFVTEIMSDVQISENYNPVREEPVFFRECSHEEQDELIRQDSKYGHVICRCETVTEAEILQAIHGKIPARTVDAIKRRTRSGMGRCQGGFCGPRIVEILSRELNIDPTDVTQKGKDSNILIREFRKPSNIECEQIS